MDFTTATDRLMALGVPLPDVAEALGVAYTTVRAFRLDPDSPSARRPPEQWRPVLVELARARGGSLLELAEELEG